MTTMKMRIESVRVAKTRVFHANFRLSEGAEQSFRYPLRPSSENYLKDIGAPGRKLIENLNRVEGITNAGLLLYQLGVDIGVMFEWDSIMPQVLSAIKDAYGDEVEVESPVVHVSAD